MERLPTATEILAEVLRRVNDGAIPGKVRTIADDLVEPGVLAEAVERDGPGRAARDRQGRRGQ
ncbi:hypothetical protein [Dactylosporangium sp. NPDC051484]|uniref:hypothetical protein n=1 Tax=Dactylosporangium sp. NPDC051484 TaxID=3154942 RepID=UPI0034508CD5